MSLESRVFENELLRAAMDATRVGVCVVDSQRVVVLLAGDFAERLGLDAADLVGQELDGVLPASLIIQSADELISVDAPEVSREARMSRADGHTSILLFQARSIDYGESGEFRAISLIDVTDFGVTRDRYLDLRRQLDALNTSVVVSSAIEPDMPIVYVNKRFEEVTGYPSSYAIGRNCRFLQGDQRDQPEVEKLRNAIERQESCHVVLKNFRRDGTPFDNDLFISPVFDDRGVATHFIGLQRESGRRASPIDQNSNVLSP